MAVRTMTIRAMAEACRITIASGRRSGRDHSSATEVAQRLASCNSSTERRHTGSRSLRTQLGARTTSPPPERSLRVLRHVASAVSDGHNSTSHARWSWARQREAARGLRTVYRAQIAGCAAVHSGATGEEVDRAARSVIEEAGFGEQFNHGLGHGLGIAKHPPHVRPGYVLAAGNAITIEPGIYIEGLGGVRIEDLGIVTETGFRSLSHAPAQAVPAGSGNDAASVHPNLRHPQTPIAQIASGRPPLFLKFARKRPRYHRA